MQYIDNEQPQWKKNIHVRTNPKDITSCLAYRKTDHSILTSIVKIAGISSYSTFTIELASLANSLVSANTPPIIWPTHKTW